MKRAWIVLATCAVLAGGLRADELHLKDGSVLNGTIVGFDENSFKVKTNYGYAIVRRDQIVSIEVRDPDGDAAAAAKKPDPNAKPPALCACSVCTRGICADAGWLDIPFGEWGACYSRSAATAWGGDFAGVRDCDFGAPHDELFRTREIAGKFTDAGAGRLQCTDSNSVRVSAVH